MRTIEISPMEEVLLKEGLLALLNLTEEANARQPNRKLEIQIKMTQQTLDKFFK